MKYNFKKDLSRMNLYRIETIEDVKDNFIEFFYMLLDNAREEGFITEELEKEIKELKIKKIKNNY